MRSVSYRVAGLLLPAVLFLFTTNAHAIVEPDRPVRIGEARWNVHISADFGEEVGRQLICSGALISPRIVITAAHCVIDAQSLGSWVLRIGYHALSSNEGVNRSPAAIVYHGKYERALTREVYDEDGNLLETILGDVRPGENDFDSDIAIIYLDKVARITPLRLPMSPNYRPAGGWRTYGWGMTGSGESDVPDRLLTAAQENHTAALAAELNDPLLHVLAAVATHNGRVSGTCWGDSGGPLVDKRGVLIGLTSFAETEICSDPAPTAFTRVSSFLTWIIEAGNVARSAARERRNQAQAADGPPFPVIAYEAPVPASQVLLQGEHR